MAIERVAAFRTSDGQHHPSVEEAQKHEFFTELLALCEEHKLTVSETSLKQLSRYYPAFKQIVAKVDWNSN